MRIARAAALTSLLVTSTVGAGVAASRSVTNLADGRMLVVVSDGGSLSSISTNGRHHIIADGVVIELIDGELTVDGEIRDVPPFTSMLEIRIVDGEVEVLGDP